MRRIPIIVNAACLVLLGSACDRAETPETSVGSDTAAAESGTRALDTIQVVLREWAISPSTENVPAGTVVFQVRNEGQYEHALEVEGNNEEKETDHIAAGQTATLAVDLKPGTYELYCPIEDTHGKHQERGMRTTITVN